MIRTLRITSIIAAILAAVLLVCAAVYGVRSDPQIEELLQAPNALDRFTASKGQHPARDEGQVSPLVRQAADFASYLNPPPPPAPPASATEAVSPEPVPLAPVSSKFDLVGTSYYASHPELSLALIDEPGKGLHWVRQGSSIAHLTIEKVSDGSITVRDGQRTFEMTVKVNEQWRSLVKGAASEAKSPPRLASGEVGSAPAGPAPVPQIYPPDVRRIKSGTPTAKTPPSAGRGRDIAALRRGPRGPANPPSAGRGSAPPRLASGETSMPGEENAAAAIPPPTQKDRVTERVMEDLRASRISPDEAIRLLQLAETLEQLEELQKQKPAPDANQ